MLKIIVFISFFTLASCLWTSKPKVNSRGQVIASSSEIVIEALEKSQTFNPAEIIAKPGQKIKFKIVNGLRNSPVNFLVLRLGDDPVVVSQLVLQEKAEKNSWLPSADYVLVGTPKLLSPSESGHLTVDMPKEEGIYYFVSTYPGQAENLHGKIVLQGENEDENDHENNKQITDNSEVKQPLAQ